jgi:hypothetical protein
MSSNPTPPVPPAPAPPAPFHPPKPDHGGHIQVSRDLLVAWVSGKPERNGPGLVPPIEQHYKGPLQQRPLSVKGDTTKERCTGLTEKFKLGGDFVKFQREVESHLKEHRLGTISYIPDPSNDTDMISIVTHHARYSTLEILLEAVKPQQARADSYGRGNDRDAIKFLLKSLDKSLIRTLISLILKEKQSFVNLWFVLVDLKQKHTVAYLDTVKAEIRAIIPENFPGKKHLGVCDGHLEQVCCAGESHGG